MEERRRTFVYFAGHAQPEDPWREEQWRSLRLCDYEEEELIEMIAARNAQANEAYMRVSRAAITAIDNAVDASRIVATNFDYLLDCYSPPKAPCAWLERWLAHHVSKDDNERVYEPTLADARLEIHDALAASRRLAARLALWKCYLAVMRAWVALLWARASARLFRSAG